MRAVRCGLLLALTLAAPAQAQAIGDFFKQAFEERLKLDPEFATMTGRNEYNDRWTDWSVAGRAQRRGALERQRQQLNKWPAANLPAQDRLTVRLLQFDWRTEIESDDVQTHLLRVGQLYGLHNRVYAAFDRMPARSVRDYENLLSRLRAVPAYIDQNIGILEESIAKGMMQPRVVIDAVTRQLEAQLAQDQTQTLLLAAFRNLPSNIPPADQARLRAQAEEAYNRRFLPAWRKFHEFLTNRYARQARSGDGVGSMAGGKEAYAILVRRLTTTAMTPEEIHKLGQEEVKRIEAEMIAVLRRAGFNGTINEYEKQLGASPDQHFASKEEMLAYCRNAAKIVEPELPRLFRNIPMLLYGIRAISPDREASTASNAQPPAPDYSSPGWFNLNAYRPEHQVRYNKEALVLHEAVPGHIFQITLAQGQHGLPDIRRFYRNSAYTEGWALYVESLGSELGVYREPASRFGQLASERFRAVRLVVDTGMHAFGWTRQQAVDYFQTHSPDNSLAEIDRYISWPAQALSYKIGQLKIRQLRTMAEEKLGMKFDIRDFHDAVLRDGTLPLDLLEQQVQDYVRSAAARR